MPDSDTPNSLSEDTRIRTNVNRLLTWGVTLVGFTAFAVTVWNKQDNVVTNLAASDLNQNGQLSALQSDVDQLTQKVMRMEANQASQTEILRYLANDRRGPIPEAAK